MVGVTLIAHPYRYPTAPRSRRHAPSGYKDYGDYKPWLEDEFTFRCVYCLKRQKWARTDVWSIDHLIPQAIAPEKEHDYDNLVLTCQWCNNRKLADLVPDPVAIAYGHCLQVDDQSGKVRPLNDEGIILERVLRLNSHSQILDRIDRIRTLRIMASCAPEVWKDLMGFPDILPNLRLKRPPKNTRPEGIDDCFYEKKIRKELPDVYE